VIVVAEFKQTVARLAEGQRLRSGAGRGEGGERHQASVTPLDRSGNVIKARRGFLRGAHRNQRAKSLQIKGSK
jgi:hypothetical protein